MRNRTVSILLTVAALLLLASLTCAADIKPPAAKPVVDSAKAGTKSAPETKGTVKKELVDINSASDAELKAIPGLGDAYVAKIIVNRPYANKTQLKSRKVVPDTLYEKIKDLVIAKQPKKK